MDNIRVYVVTYNVATLFPDPRTNVNRLLGFPDSSPDTVKDLPHIYAIGCQEVKSQPQNYVYDFMFDDPWTALFKAALVPLDYVKYRTLRLQGVVLSLFVRRSLLLKIRSVETSFVRLGLGGYWGNKGAVSMRLSLQGVNLCVLNCHLTAHEHLLAERIRNYNDILKYTSFQEPETRQLFYHDYLIWLGDLNFRVSAAPVQAEDGSAPLDDSAVRQLASDHQLTPLLALDQLRAARSTGVAFSELSEPTITFKPTYKLVPGTKNQYSPARRPGWTDRILYKVNPDVYDGVRLGMEPLSYQSHPDYCQSDHQPVTAEFSIKVFRDRPVPCVEFLPVTVWVSGSDCVAKYRRDPQLETSVWDWIALFRANFGSLDEYITYIWAPQSPSSPSSDHYIAIFPEDSVTIPGSYVLVYFGRNGNGVYGISDPFTVQYSHHSPTAGQEL